MMSYLFSILFLFSPFLLVPPPFFYSAFVSSFLSSFLFSDYFKARLFLGHSLEEDEEERRKK